MRYTSENPILSLGNTFIKIPLPQVCGSKSRNHPGKEEMKDQTLQSCLSVPPPHVGFGSDLQDSTDLTACPMAAFSVCCG
jgi:hypothetical protein